MNTAPKSGQEHEKCRSHDEGCSRAKEPVGSDQILTEKIAQRVIIASEEMQRPHPNNGK